MLNLNQLMVVLAVAEHGGVGRAAAALGLSQPAVSRTVKELESHLDVRLFERTPHGVHVTEAGRALVAHARTVRDDTLAVERAVAGARGRAQSRLTVGIAHVVPDALFAPALRATLSAHPGAHVEVLRRPGPELVERLGRAELDLVFVNAPTSPDNLVRSTAQVEAAPLYADEMVVVAAARHVLRRRRRVDLAALGAVSWIGWPRDTAARREVDEAFASWGLPAPVPRIEADSPSLLLGLVAATDLLALVPRALARSAEGIGVVRVAHQPVRRLALVLWPRGRAHGPLAESFLANVRAACADLVRRAR